MLTADHHALMFAIARQSRSGLNGSDLIDIDLLELSVLAARLEWSPAQAARVARDLGQYGYIRVDGNMWFGRSIRYVLVEMTDDGRAEVKRLITSREAEHSNAANTPSVIGAGGECKHCGWPHTRVARYCPRCGRPVEVEVSVSDRG